MATTLPRSPWRSRAPGRPDRPSDAVRDIGPNWYASVMGTAIVANAAATLPLRVPGLRSAALVIWALSFLLLALVLAARTAHQVRHGWHRHLRDPAAAPFYGCLPMAMLAVGAGTLLVGRDLIGTRAAVGVHGVLWTAGALVSVAVAVAVPYLMFTRHELRPETTFATWLLPIVAPMVAAATGPMLVPHLPAGSWRATLLMACLAMFGISLFSTLIILPGLWNRLAYHKVGPPQMTPTLWLVLGPLGQSATAVAAIAAFAPGSVPEPYAQGLTVLAVLYAVPVLGFAMMWLVLAGSITIRALRDRMPFALTWWGFTFPLGTCVTGMSALAGATSLAAVKWLSVLLYALLAVAWSVVAARTLRGVVNGGLLAGGSPPPSVPAGSTP